MLNWYRVTGKVTLRFHVIQMKLRIFRRFGVIHNPLLKPYFEYRSLFCNRCGKHVGISYRKFKSSQLGSLREQQFLCQIG